MTKEEAIQTVLNHKISLKDLVRSCPCREEFVPLALHLGWISAKDGQAPRDILFYGVTHNIVDNAYPGLLDRGISFTVADVFNSAMKTHTDHGFEYARSNVHYCLYYICNVQAFTNEVAEQSAFPIPEGHCLGAGYWLRDAVLDELERMWKEGRKSKCLGRCRK